MLNFTTDSKNLYCNGGYFFRDFTGRSFRQKIILILLIIFSSFSSYSIAGIQEKQDIPKMVQRADLIIRGKVISTESQWKEDSRGRHIYTSVTVKILDKIKGNIKDDAFAFEVVGGIVDDIGEVVSGTPVFEIDEEAIVFLAGDPLTIQHGTNGKIPIYDGTVYWDDLEVTVDSFIQALKVLEQDPNAPVSLGEKYQAPTPEVTAADCYIYNGHKWFGTSPTVYYKINENTLDCYGEGAAVQRAASTWNNACDVVNFRFEYDGSCYSTGASQNYVNCITWGTLPYGTVAEATHWYKVSTGEIIECDTVFNDPDYDWSTKTTPYSWEWDVESVALHEFGHWLNLGDLYDIFCEEMVMYYERSSGYVKRELGWGDIDGICYIYGCEGCPEIRPCEECEPEDEYLGTIGTSVWGYSKSGNCGKGGKWVGQFVGEAGKTYHFDLCPDSPGSGIANFDADIKITNSSCSILDGEDGFCSSPSYLPNNFQWACPANGTYYVIIAPYNSYNSHTCGGDSSDTFTLEYYKDEGDAYEPDNTAVQANEILPDSPQTHSIAPVGDVDYVRFSLDSESEVVIETSGLSGDTEMWLYDDQENQIDYDDDGGTGLFSRIERTCEIDALSAGTYYVKVAEYGNNAKIDSYEIILTVTPCAGPDCPTITIGTDTSKWTYPMHTYYHDSRTQVIYLSSEIGMEGTITALGLDVATVPGQIMYNWTIRMKHTALSEYSTCSLDATGWTIVYENDETAGSTGWRTFTFSSPFEYNGTDNLLVDFSHNNSSYTSNGECMASSPGETRSTYAYSDSGYGDPLSWSGTTSPTVYCSTYVPNVQLTICVEPYLDPPVLHEEPNITPGLCNTIYWDPVTDADEYYAECANDVNFTIIDANSGWITDPNYEFCSLELGQTYWYHVKARTAGDCESDWSNVESSLQCALGDFEPDCDVDMADLAVFVDQWLLAELSADVAPIDEGDNFVDFLDWAVFANAWQSTPASPNNWNPKCDIAPEEGDDIVDIDDLAVFVYQWLQLFPYRADIAPVPDGDGRVDMLDFAVFAENWLEGKI